MVAHGVGVEVGAVALPRRGDRLADDPAAVSNPRAAGPAVRGAVAERLAPHAGRIVHRVVGPVAPPSRSPQKGRSGPLGAIPGFPLRSCQLMQHPISSRGVNHPRKLVGFMSQSRCKLTIWPDVRSIECQHQSAG